MANSNVPMFIQAIETWALQLSNASGTTITTLLTAGTNGSKVEVLNVSNTDTLGYVLNLYVNDGTTNHLIATVSIPASAGNNTATAPVNILASSNLASLPYDSNGNRYLYLKAGYKLNIGVTATITTGKFVDAVVVGGDF